LPALDGVLAKLEAGATVADVGCGHGASTMLMAKAFPRSRFHGFDYHAPSIERARQAADAAGVADRVAFEQAPAAAYSGRGYDLVTFFDCLHDMGDPVGAARHVGETLAPDGTWMIVEPFAHDHMHKNFNPVGRVYAGAALGAQAGEARLREVVPQAASPASARRPRRHSTSCWRRGRREMMGFAALLPPPYGAAA
jgi:trans-aconitate methyltransferase